MGLHTGTPYLTEEGYVGVDFTGQRGSQPSRTAARCSSHASTAALLDGEGLRDLGEHRLKDLSGPERIYQLGDREFPPLRSLYRTNLPIAATSFLGRERELAEVLALLSQPTFVC